MKLHALPGITGLCRMFALAFFCANFLAATQAQALEPVEVTNESVAIDLTRMVELHQAAGESLAVTTAPDANGVINRIEIRSSAPDTSGNWATFALANNTDEQIERLIVAPYFRLSRSGLFWPDLGKERIETITPSEGFALDRLSSNEADIFSITLNPGSIITFVAELSGDELPQLTLWEPDAYKDTVNSYTLYEGIVLGISGLLAVFLTILFVVKGSAMFPATAALAWAVLAYICVDFGFLNKVISMSPSDQNIWRAGTEVMLCVCLILFLYAYLHLNRWNTRYSYLTILWLAGLATLLGVAIVAPSQAAGIARFSFALVAALGLLLIIYLSARSFDRAILLIPTWLLVLAWVLGAWLTVIGQLDNDIIQPALGGGLVLIVLLISFTVMQHAFAGGTLMQGLVSDLERQALALTGSGDAVWDWDVDRDEIYTGPELAMALGLGPRDLNGSPQNWLDIMHGEDRDRFKSILDIMLEHRRGRIAQEFRLKARTGQYHWLSIKAKPVIGSDGEVLRCVGTVTDTTEHRVAQHRLLHDAVHDNLTGLPNRELFMDRLETALSLARVEKNFKPTIIVIDVDRFSKINESLGLSVGDNVLLTISRRLTRLLKPQDSLARLHGDQFGLLLLSQSDPERVAIFADAVQRAINAPAKFGDNEIFATASIGLISWSEDQIGPEDMLKDAEIAMLQAKKVGGDRIEPFRPAFRSQQVVTGHLESDLRRAIDQGEMEMVFQPIIRLENQSVAGFEALMRWRHPRRGMISPTEFIPLAEKSGLIIPLGLFALEKSAEELANWQKALGDVPVFVSVNISSRQLLRHDLINDVKNVLARSRILPQTLKLELTESLIMENPEQSAQVLRDLKKLGAGLSLDDFGTGYSSLSHLMRFPFDTIKIDRSFVSEQQGKGRPIILRSIIGLAHDLGMEVVAEGAEDETDALELHQLGCEYAQGFLFGEPISASVALQALQQDYPLTK